MSRAIFAAAGEDPNEIAVGFPAQHGLVKTQPRTVTARLAEVCTDTRLRKQDAGAWLQYGNHVLLGMQCRETGTDLRGREHRMRQPVNLSAAERSFNERAVGPADHQATGFKQQPDAG